jgi:hypothetical protein
VVHFFHRDRGTEGSFAQSFTYQVVLSNEAASVSPLPKPFPSVPTSALLPLLDELAPDFTTSIESESLSLSQPTVNPQVAKRPDFAEPSPSSHHYVALDRFLP